MTNDINEKPVSNQNRAVGMRATGKSEVEAIGGGENVKGMDETEDTMEDDLDDFYLPDYGGSE